MNREPTNATSDRSRNWHDRLEVIADLMQQNLTVTEHAIEPAAGPASWGSSRTTPLTTCIRPRCGKSWRAAT